MGLRGKFQPAVLLGNDHPEKTFVLDELPNLRRQVGTLVGDVPVVQHRAQLLHLVIKKSLLFPAQSALRKSAQLVPVGMAAEQLAIPPHRAGIDRLLFGGGDVRQDFAEQFQYRAADDGAAQPGNTEEHDEQEQRDVDHLQCGIGDSRLDGDDRNHHHHGEHPTGDGGAKECKEKKYRENCKYR